MINSEFLLDIYLDCQDTQHLSYTIINLEEMFNYSSSIKL